MLRRILAAIVTPMCLFLLTLIASAQGPGSGPFGLRKGLTKPEVEKLAGPLKPGQPGIFMTQRVPKPDPDFQRYALVITPKNGLCAIVAAGKTVEIDAFGTQIQSAFGSLKSSLTKTYGAPPKVDDVLRHGSNLDKPKDWAMGLASHHRVLAAGWVLEGNPAGIGKIELSATGLSRSKAYVTLTYGFDIPGACIEELKQLRRATVNERPSTPGSM